MIRRTAMGLMALTLLLPASASARADSEQACADLGANCICSEPLEMTGFTNPSGNTEKWNPNDSTQKQCDGESYGTFGDNSGYVISTSGGQPFTVGSDSAVLSAMPAGHTAPRYWRGNDGHTGTLEFDLPLKAGVTLVRVATRWYQYHSTNYEFADKGNPANCQNSMKWFSLRNTAGNSTTQWDTANGANSVPLIYAWTTGNGIPWTPSLDCCNFGPGWANAGSIDPLAQSIIVGHWYRYEVILRHMDGSAGVKMQAFRKDVTAGTAEVKIIDTTVACVGCGTSQDWTVASGATTTLTMPASGALTLVEVNTFRNAGSGNHCNGYRAYSHLMQAAWNTDATQRILGAVEVEGGGGPPTPPGTPANLNITQGPVTLGVALVGNELRRKTR